MSNNKQSSVDFIRDSLIKYIGFEDIESTKIFDKIFEQAKEMEKEEILHSYADGQADTLLMFKQKISKMKDIPSEFNQLISENFWDLV